MNEKNSEEIRYRRLAFKLFDKGKSSAEILARLPRSRFWLFKWKKRFEREGWQVLDSRSKAPHHSPHEYSSEAVKLVVRLRKRMEKSIAGLVGACDSTRITASPLDQSVAVVVDDQTLAQRRWADWCSDRTTRPRLLSDSANRRRLGHFLLRLDRPLFDRRREGLRLSHD